jgi:2-polyprenyl-6-methoxyphenol hydroxylase-like FAD-dependent oxidoreductase
MRILRSLGDGPGSVYESVCAAGFKVQSFVFKAARGWRLLATPAGDRRGTKGFPEGEEEVCLAVSRQGLWEALYRAVGAENVGVKKVIGVRKATEGKKAVVVFEGGEEEEADLIVGADGVRSVVRMGLFEGREEEFKPKYEGLIGVGGFTDDVVPAEIIEEKSMVFEFGPNGFFGYSAISPKTCMWWSTCQAEDVPPEKRISPDEMRKELIARHATWKDPHVHDIIDKSEVTQIWPTWTVPELPIWGENGIVLIGDAAHALQPTSGQGSSQSLEDAKCFALLLSKFLDKSQAQPEQISEKEVVELSIKSFYQVRQPRLHKILVRTNKMSRSKLDMSYPAEMMTYFFLWLMGKTPSLGKFHLIIS